MIVLLWCFFGFFISYVFWCLLSKAHCLHFRRVVNHNIKLNLELNINLNYNIDINLNLNVLPDRLHSG